ncbi:MAG: ribosome silencing factor [Candidatus Marinimicrobia bacterium]|jgi:ribosome-associated protein|nr:ribosome silencing factor [Candidatus Neomarinimicrobiota bacterium]|tara:strand:- start:5681 stop:6040 length:360 start_codon:yes stop_codon:yes gene_type:complete
MKSQNIENKKIVNQFVELMQDKKVQDIVILDVKELTSLTDYFILCTSESTPQTKAVMDHIYKNMRANGLRPNNLEDTKTLEWVAMDYFNVVIHIFNKETRDYYQFERLWGDAKIEKIDE